MITTYGVENSHANLLVQNEVTMDDLFQDKMYAGTDFNIHLRTRAREDLRSSSDATNPAQNKRRTQNASNW